MRIMVPILLWVAVMGFKIYIRRPDKLDCRECGKAMKRDTRRRYNSQDGWRIEETWRCKPYGFDKTTDVPDLI